jgi:PAS domain-containing protein
MRKDPPAREQNRAASRAQTTATWNRIGVTPRLPHNLTHNLLAPANRIGVAFALLGRGAVDQSGFLRPATAMTTSGQHWEPRIVRDELGNSAASRSGQPPASDRIVQLRAELSATDWLTHALDTVPDLAMILNRDREIVYANQPTSAFAGTTDWRDVTGLQPGELLNCHNVRPGQGRCGTGPACKVCGAFRSIVEALEGHSASREWRILRLRPGGEEPLNLRVSVTPFDWRGERLVLLFAGDSRSAPRRLALERLFLSGLRVFPPPAR